MRKLEPSAACRDSRTRPGFGRERKRACGKKLPPASASWGRCFNRRREPRSRVRPSGVIDSEPRDRRPLEPETGRSAGRSWGRLAGRDGPPGGSAPGRIPQSLSRESTVHANRRGRGAARKAVWIPSCRSGSTAPGDELLFEPPAPQHATGGDEPNEEGQPGDPVHDGRGIDPDELHRDTEDC